MLYISLNVTEYISFIKILFDDFKEICKYSESLIKLKNGLNVSKIILRNCFYTTNNF